MEFEKGLYEPHKDLIDKYNDAKIRTNKQYDTAELFVFYGVLPSQALYPQQALQAIFSFIQACHNSHSELCNELLRKLIDELAKKDESHQCLKSFFVSFLYDLQKNKKAWVWLDFLSKVDQNLASEVYSNVVGRPGFSYFTVFEPIMNEAFFSISKTESPKNSFSAHLVKNNPKFAQYALARFAKSSQQIEKISDNIRTGSINRDAAQKFVGQQKELQKSLGHVIIKWAVDQSWISESILKLFGISRASIQRAETLLLAIQDGLTPQEASKDSDNQRDSQRSTASIENLDFLPKPDIKQEVLVLHQKQGSLPPIPDSSDPLQGLPPTPESNSLSLSDTPGSDPQNLPSTPSSSSLPGTPSSEQNLVNTPSTVDLQPTPTSDTKSSSKESAKGSDSQPTTPIHAFKGKKPLKENWNFLTNNSKQGKSTITVNNPSHEQVMKGMSALITLYECNTKNTTRRAQKKPSTIVNDENQENQENFNPRTFSK